MDAKLLRIMERKTYKTFTLVGKLYLKFLKEKPWGASFDNPVIATAHNELSTQNQPEEENKLNQTAIIQTQEKTDNFIFRKDVDLSLPNTDLLSLNRLLMHFAQILALRFRVVVVTA